VQLAFINKLELVYKEMEDFIQNRKFEDVHTDHFGKTESMGSYLKHFRQSLLYIPKTTESIHDGLQHTQILQKPGNLAGHYLRTHILMATSIIYKTA
jgi:hypothetical protein